MERALSRAFAHGDFDEALQRIRKRPFELVDFRLPSTRADTLLLAACIHGRWDVAEELLSLDAEPFFNFQTTHGRNIFTVAQTPEQVRVLELVLRHTAHWQEPESVRAWEVAYESAVETAAPTGDFARLLRLLRFRPSLINHVTVTGTTAISAAHKHGDVELVKEFMRLGGDPWAGFSDPFSEGSSEAHQEILNHIIDSTGALEAGSPWDEMREAGISFSP